MKTTRRFLAVTATAAAMLLLWQPVAQAASIQVAVWHMDDRGTTMTDSSGRGHNGTMRNVTGNGSYFTFAGAPSYVSVPTADDLNPGSSTFAVSVRVNFPRVPTRAVGDFDLVRKGLAGTKGGHFKVEIVANGKGYCLFHGSAGKVVISAGPNLAGTGWHTITCTRTATGVTLTVDGRNYVKRGATGQLANTKTLLVGIKTPGGGDQYTGLMDEVVIRKG